MSFQSITAKIISSLFGLILTLGSLYAQWIVLHQKPIDLHLVYAFLGTLVLGAGLVIPGDLYLMAQRAVALYKEWKSTPK